MFNKKNIFRLVPAWVMVAGTGLVLVILMLPFSTSAAGAANARGAAQGYPFLSIVIVSILAYALTMILVMKKVMSQLWHRRIWNILLLVSFLLSGISGIFLILRMNYGFNPSWPFDLLELHVETGMVMAMISFFHIAWHWRYYTTCLKRNNRDQASCEDKK